MKLIQAVKNYNLALAKNPDDTKSLYNLARLYFEKEEYELAQKHFEKIITVKPNDYESLFLLASAEHSLEKYTVAIHTTKTLKKEFKRIR